MLVLAYVEAQHHPEVLRVRSLYQCDSNVICNTRSISNPRDRCNRSVCGALLQAINRVLARGKKPKGDCYAWERGLGEF